MNRLHSRISRNVLDFTELYIEALDEKIQELEAEQPRPRYSTLRKIEALRREKTELIWQKERLARTFANSNC